MRRARLPYIALNLPIAAGKEVWRLYDETAERVGYKAGPQYHGYLLRVRVDETEEKALRNAREFMWMQGEFTGLTHPVWAAPPATWRMGAPSDGRVTCGLSYEVKN